MKDAIRVELEECFFNGYFASMMKWGKNVHFGLEGLEFDFYENLVGSVFASKNHLAFIIIF